MSDEIRVNRPSGQPQVRPETYASEEEASAKSSKMPWVILALVVIVIVVLGFAFRDKMFQGKDSGSMVGKTETKGSGYQAVFLTNGQVYFGKITATDKSYVTLTDIFYLQVVQPPLQGQQAPGQAAPAGQQPQISLVKLGQELHGPVDEMHISQSQILFYEDLKEEGSVVKAIVSYKANPTGAPAAPAQ